MIYTNVGSFDSFDAYQLCRKYISFLLLHGTLMQMSIVDREVPNAESLFLCSNDHMHDICIARCVGHFGGLDLARHISLFTNRINYRMRPNRSRQSGAIVVCIN
eukprot:519424_1